jgi:chemotaxis signal transduction protein
MSKGIKAWKLHWHAAPLALAQCEVIEVAEEPEIYRVPLGPTWCRGLLHWRGQLIPLAIDANQDSEGRYIVVVAYQRGAQQSLQFAAFAVTQMPQQFDVPEAADCDLPASSFFSADEPRACLQHEGNTWIVPDLHKLFAGSHSNL